MQQGILSPYNFNVTFYKTRLTYPTDTILRILHNGEQIVVLKQNLGLQYFNLDGTAMGFYPLSAKDICCSPDGTKMYALTNSMQLAEIDQKGNIVRSIIDNITTSGTSYNIATDGSYLYLRTDTDVYKYGESLYYGTDDGTQAITHGASIIPTGATSFQFFNGDISSLIYIYHDSGSNMNLLKCISQNSLTNLYRTALLNTYPQSPFPNFFWNTSDWSTLYYLETSGVDAVLKGYDLDSILASFCNTTSSNPMLSAGSGATSAIQAEVMNCWGDKLDGKLVTFTVSGTSGGSVGPSQRTTGTGGQPTGTASSVYLVGVNAGTDAITATVSEVV